MGDQDGQIKGDRIAKVMARAGLCSRRDAERWIAQGRVMVNGRVIDSPALNIVSDDVVVVDGMTLQEPDPVRMWLYHKPPGLVTTHKDPEGRSTVFETLPSDLPRVISVGRLDLNSEGLLLLTNDGALARYLEKPSSGWVRTYRVRAFGKVPPDFQEQLKDGITVDYVSYGPIEVEIERNEGANKWFAVKLTEGKNREIRRVFESMGLSVSRLIRVSYGPFELGRLKREEVSVVPQRQLKALMSGRAIEPTIVTGNPITSGARSTDKGSLGHRKPEQGSKTNKTNTIDQSGKTRGQGRLAKKKRRQDASEKKII